MVCANPQSGFYTSNIKVKQPMIKDLRLNYGEKFPEIHKKLLEQLCKTDSSGITFLHGPSVSSFSMVFFFFFFVFIEFNV